VQIKKKLKVFFKHPYYAEIKSTKKPKIRLVSSKEAEGLLQNEKIEVSITPISYKKVETGDIAWTYLILHNQRNELEKGD